MTLKKWKNAALLLGSQGQAANMFAKWPLLAGFANANENHFRVHLPRLLWKGTDDPDHLTSFLSTSQYFKFPEDRFAEQYQIWRLMQLVHPKMAFLSDFSGNAASSMQFWTLPGRSTTVNLASQPLSPSCWRVCRGFEPHGSWVQVASFPLAWPLHTTTA